MHRMGKKPSCCLQDFLMPCLLNYVHRTFHADIRENAVDCIPITHYSDRNDRIFYDQACIETGGSYLR